MPAGKQSESDAIIFVVVFFLGAIPLSFLPYGLFWQFLWLCLEIFVASYISLHGRIASLGPRSVLKEHEAGTIGFQKHVRRFQRSLGTLLTWMGRAAGDSEHSRTGYFFTAKSFALALKLSAIYPFMLLTLGWMLGGSAIIANFYVIPPIPKQALLTSMAVVFVPALLLGLLVRLLRTRQLWILRNGLAYLITGIFIIFAFGFAIVVGRAVYQESFIDIALPLGVFAIVGVIFFGAVAGFKSNTNAFLPIAFLPLLFSLNAMLAVPFVGRAGAVIAAFLFSFTRIWDRFRLGSLYVTSLLLIMIGVPLALIVIDQPQDKIFFFVERFGAHIAAVPMVLILGLLPIVNALVDWSSFNVTRSILWQVSRRSQNLSQILLWLALDVFVAVFLCLLVLGSIVGFAAFVDYYHMPGITDAEATRLDSESLTRQIRAVSLDIENLWLVGIAVTGMIPSILSLAALISATAFAFLDWQSQILTRLKTAETADLPDDARERVYRSVAIQLAATLTASVLLSGLLLFLIWFGIRFVISNFT